MKVDLAQPPSPIEPDANTVTCHQVQKVAHIPPRSSPANLWTLSSQKLWPTSFTAAAGLEEWPVRLRKQVHPRAARTDGDGLSRVGRAFAVPSQDAARSRDGPG